MDSGWLVCLIKAQCADLMLISAQCLQVRLLFIFASAIVWWSGVCTVAPGREEEKENKSLWAGLAPSVSWRLKPLLEPGRETITLRFLLGTLSHSPACLCIFFASVAAQNFFFSETAAPILHTEIRAMLGWWYGYYQFASLSCSYLQVCTRSSFRQAWWMLTWPMFKRAYVGLRTARCELLPTLQWALLRTQTNNTVSCSSLDPKTVYRQDFSCHRHH